MPSLSFSSSLRKDRIGVEDYDEKRSRGLSTPIDTLKSCFGRGFDVDTGSRKHYVQCKAPARGFDGQDVYGIQAEYLEEDNMGWGKPKRLR